MRHFYSALLPVLLCTPLLAAAAHAQSIPRAEADSLLRGLQAGKADTNHVHRLIRLGEHQVYKPGEFKADMDSARSYAVAAQALSRRLKYYPGEARSLNLLGTISRESKDFPGAIACQEQAIRLNRQHRDVAGAARSLLLLAHAWRDKGDAPRARQAAQQAVDLCRRNGYFLQTGEACLALGNTYADAGEELHAKIGHYQQALGWFTRIGDRKRSADVHKDLGDLYHLQGNPAKSLLELQKALALYQSVGYLPVQGVYDLLGNISTEMGDYQEGLRYGLMAVKTAERLGDSTLQLCTIYNRVGTTYFRIQQFQKAHLYYNKAMVIARKYDDRPSILVMSHNIASILLKLGQTEASLRLLLGTARQYPPVNSTDSIHLAASVLVRYTLLKRYAAAQRYCNQLLSFSERLDKNDYNRTAIYNAVIKFLMTTQRHEAARKQVAAYEAFCTNTNYLRGASNAQLYWFQLDSMQANYPSAIRHYQRYKVLADSLENQARNRQIASLDVQYETEKKEQDIKLKEQSIKALTRERQLQAKQMEKDQVVRNALGAGAVLLLALLALGYNRYRLKQRSNRQLQAQQLQLQAQHEALQAQQDELQTQQEHIHQQNEHLSDLLLEKDSLLMLKDVLLEEKEGLLKEIHHRVKNNLQIVMSLLNSQAASLADKAALSAIRESQHRVQAMALIHQKLYQSEGLARIPMPDYVHELVCYLRDSYQPAQPVRFHLEVDPVELDVTQAVPLGLILNEAVTNAFKYAFPDGRAGTVTISLHQLPGVEPAAYELRIEDDGVGLPENFKPSRSRSLGMTLLHGFSRQLKGKLTLGGPPGLSIRLTFAEEKLAPAPAPPPGRIAAGVPAR